MIPSAFCLSCTMSDVIIAPIVMPFFFYGLGFF
jgi:hypothetical protein